jgi:hypothetical protein
MRRPRRSLIPIKKVGIYVTAASVPHSIGIVLAPKSSATWARRTGLALTKRRAVDFCRVTTAICPAS